MDTERQRPARGNEPGIGGAAAAASAEQPGGTQAFDRTGPTLFSTDTGRGRPVVLLHGWTCDSHDWSWQLPLLEAKYRVLAVDLRGHGRSDVVAPGGYAPDDYVGDVEALLASHEAGQPFVAIGHSMGGQIAARIAARRPDLVGAVVSVDGALGFSAETATVFSKVNEDLQSGDPAAVVTALFRNVYDPATPEPFRRWHARRVQGLPSHVVRETFGPLFFGPGQVGVGDDSARFCASLSVPVYHLCRDPVQADRMRSWFGHPRSLVEVWSASGHWIMQDRPMDVNAAITSWIDRL